MANDPNVEGAALACSDAAALSRIRAICDALPHVEEAELQGRPLFRVGRRRFAIFNGDTSPPRARWEGCGRSLHFLADPLELDALRNDARFHRSPHHPHQGWMFLSLDDEPQWDEVVELLDTAWNQVSPARLKRE